MKASLRVLNAGVHDRYVGLFRKRLVRGAGDGTVVFNKTSVKVAEPEESLEVLYGGRDWPGLNGLVDL